MEYSGEEQQRPEHVQDGGSIADGGGQVKVHP